MTDDGRRRCVRVTVTPAEEFAALVADLGELHPFVRAVGRGERELAGGTYFMCGRFKREDICSRCGGFSEALCDWPMGRGKTCDAPLCRKCARAVAHEVDLCPVHAAMFDQHGRMP